MFGLGKTLTFIINIFLVGSNQIWELFCFALVLISKFLVKKRKLATSGKSDALRLGVGLRLGIRTHA